MTKSDEALDNFEPLDRIVKDQAYKGSRARCVGAVSLKSLSMKDPTKSLDCMLILFIKS